MDIQTIIATVGTVVLGVTVVWKYAGKYIGIIKEVSELLAKVADSLGDQKLTADEIVQIKKEAKDIVNMFKK